MKKIAFCLGLFIFSAMSYSLSAQNIVEAEENENNFDGFYVKHLSSEKRAIPFAPVRESDIVWKTCIWRTIDMREKFNQFFYFPTQPETAGNTQQRKNLFYTIWDALESGQIEAYEPDDDEFKRPPLDFEALKAKYFRIDTSGYTDEDEDGNEIWVTTYVERKLEAQNVYQVKLKEYWYINKQDTRQNVRIVGLAFVYNECRDRDGEMECNPITLFWIPMNDMRVRNVLVKHDAYDEFNQASPRSYDDIFIQRYFESFIIRETNDYNRSIADYLTGEDALIESENISERIFNIELDMWEY